MAIWFISDTHFGHSNIIRYCKRPFVDVNEMDAAIIKNWNERVNDKDEVWHLGDFCLDANKHNGYLEQLKGKLHFIHGNHDRTKVKKHSRWISSSPFQEIHIEDTHITLCHYAMRVWNRSHHRSLQLYGHSHSTLPGTDQSLDVGVDCWDFKPVSLAEIKARLATLPPYRSRLPVTAIPEDN
jgi:calcineurin-like phosphoesterase family protein